MDTDILVQLAGAAYNAYWQHITTDLDFPESVKNINHPWDKLDPTVRAGWIKAIAVAVKDEPTQLAFKLSALTARVSQLERKIAQKDDRKTYVASDDLPAGW
jgi:hypothetical protein